ncbi:DUF6223 family protein [Promicromonospora sp. NPDC060271]|uniref:DUF6223 family protein n=1 Tax=Promicromonospora sp. NPDC060271 TaxID=3347089 RepID=UPI0036523110
MSVRKVRAATAVTSLLGTLVLSAALAGPASALGSAPPVDAYQLTFGRFGATTGAALALIGVGFGVVALLRSSRRRRSAVIAAALGLGGVVIGAVFLAIADGGPGTGNGVVGSWVSFVLGPIALLLAWRGLRRSAGAPGT